MSIIREKSYYVNKSDNFYDTMKNIANDWGKTYTDVKNIYSATDEKKIKIYLDETENVYLIFAYGEGNASNPFSITLYAGNSGYYVINSEELNEKVKYVVSDKSPDGSVLYFRAEISDNGAGVSVIAAKDESSKWACFTTNKMVTYANSYNLDDTYITPYDSSMFSAFVTPNVENGGKFPSLLKMFSARSASRTNLYVTFNDKPYRVVSTNIAASISAGANYPAFAFEAQQE